MTSLPADVEAARRGEQQRIAELNRLAAERQELEARQPHRNIALMRPSEILEETRQTVIGVVLDLQRGETLWACVARRPERWPFVGVFLLAIAALLYLTDVFDG